ncbi:hypothetical protein [Pseudoalteromonas luteoviolacea]|uniref:Uncharacterized protein n=1 Tax=Pseudoalteromonas luteoviolacea S4054 TaxID=1129367 RepID=A0A0F6AGQ9_9GAMM|nr:hypothetical protein [Pseudoalteromonas luteoviolacea]AOT07177.1 hypothetical protein S4054249_04590 [Pseudoalteromonas luteoviolacea]AOT12093.1 hypothetical protein S40542_04590 [Pseudoalteromonas luteoviolacea]AOT17006.1 hypothetical protein S4054_04590 [Pseudoalteromonas luteoviolacea]KKE85400.1 hypothetical protein N479_05195 [Pseudoalteromonas luteoviolacea S4054]KZN73748.1 hypothetical protein N481_11605 [Pseudoalteromonas luteoviolacea S4047-1]
MSLKLDNFLLVDSNWEFSQEFVEFVKSLAPDTPSQLIIAGDNTKQMLKMMFKDQIKDYSYCDFDNEISVSELATYLHEHHKIQGVLIYALDYNLADEKQKFIFNSLHAERYTIEQLANGYDYHRINDTFNNNHLTCNSSLAATKHDTFSEFVVLKTDTTD